MSKLNLSSSIKEHNGSWTSPDWGEIEKLLRRLEHQSGSIVVSVIDGPDIGPDCLSVGADSGYYLLSMLDNITEDDDVVRTYTNTRMSSKQPKIEILGDYWPSDMLTNDLDLVISVFKEFYETGNVSQDILSE